MITLELDVKGKTKKAIIAGVKAALEAIVSDTTQGCDERDGFEYIFKVEKI